MRGRLSRGRLLICLLLMGTILHHLFSNEYGPLDRFLEIGVFFLILYEIVSPHTLIRRAIRRKRIRRIQANLRVLFTAGETIRQKVPNWLASPEPEWMEAAQKWIVEAETYLGNQPSDRALIEFRHMGLLESEQRRVMDAQGRIWSVVGVMGDRFQQLSIRMNNLHRLIQETDAYF
jgi:hypothetical protein